MIRVDVFRLNSRVLFVRELFSKYFLHFLCTLREFCVVSEPSYNLFFFYFFELDFVQFNF